MMAHADDARAALSDGRRADRLRAHRLLVQSDHLRRSASCCRRAGARFRSAPAPRPARSASSCSRRSASSLIDKLGWQTTLRNLRRHPAADHSAVARDRDLAAGCAGRKLAPATRQSSSPARPDKQALAEAFGHRSFVLLVLGYFTCGFQLQFVTAAPAVLSDRPRACRPKSAAGRSGIIGLFNIVGALLVGLSRRAACPSATSCRSSIRRARSP